MKIGSRGPVAVLLLGLTGGCRIGYELTNLDNDTSDTGVGGGAGAPALDSGGSDDSGTNASSSGGSTGGSNGATSSGGAAASTGGAAEGGSGGSNSTGGTAGGGSGSGGEPGSGGTATTTGAGGAAGGAGSGGATTTASGGASTTTGGGTGGTPPAVGEDPYCERIHRLSSAPTVDGVLDAGLPLQDLPKTAVRIPTDNPAEFSSLPNDVSLRFAVAWFDTGMYFFAEVTDPDRYPAIMAWDEWMGDGFEFYVDHDGVFAPPGQFDNAGTRTFTIAAPDNDTDPSTRGGVFRPFSRQGPWRGDFIAIPTTAGYDAEAIIVADDLNLNSWSLQPGDSLGFDVSHGVSFPAGEVGSEGRRLGHYFLQIADGATGVNEDYPFYNSGVYCLPVLEDTP